MTARMDRIGIAIVGGGPSCTYALERLAAELPAVLEGQAVSVHVFERTGRFGAGMAHSDTQPPTSYMNRITAQIAFGADESNSEAGRLLPRESRRTFVDWCKAKFEETGDPQYNLQAQQTPRRYLHGMALRDMFERYASILREAGVEIELVAKDVTDLVPDRDSPRIFVVTDDGGSFPADFVLCVTGHSWNRSEAEENSMGFIPTAYPLEQYVTRQVIPAGSSVGIRGLGLTAIDVCLWLTEGRGGRFVSASPESPPWQLQYEPSGQEPRRIICFSPSGVPVRTRPMNAKFSDVRLEHQGRFFSSAAIARLRETVGRAAALADGAIVRRLDFERHVLPLIVLEMAYVHDRTLLGAAHGERIVRAVHRDYCGFLATGAPTLAEGIERLLAPVNACFDEIAERISRRVADHPPSDWEGDEEAWTKFQHVVRGDSIDPALGIRGVVSPWGHSPDIRQHRFDWRRVLEPMPPESAIGARDWHERVVSFVARDCAFAAQGNLDNPIKAACDGVWRDQRAVFCAVAERGGLLPESQRVFDHTYFRHYCRLSNGPTLEAMAKFLALMEHGVVELSVGPDPWIGRNENGGGFRIEGGRTHTVRYVETLVEGRVHDFDPERDRSPLYRRLLERGLVRLWRNPGIDGAPDYVPGALDLTCGFHPLSASGAVDDRLTFLGAPAERLCYFQLAAARPSCDNRIINNVAVWARSVCSKIVSEMEPVPSTEDTM